MDKPESNVKPDEPSAVATPPRPPRPFSVTLLVLGVLIITVINLVRLVVSLRDWDFLASWPGVSPLYIALTGLIWTLAGAGLLWGLWTRKAWAPRLMQAVALTYALYYWLDVVFLENHGVSGSASTALLPVNWPFAVGVTVVSLAYIEWTLTRRKVKQYFHQVEVEASQMQTPGDHSG
ncbi:MAG TPA: hypothetical protein VF831_03110 [Anaerolineales bacterium]